MGIENQDFSKKNYPIDDIENALAKLMAENTLLEQQTEPTEELKREQDLCKQVAKAFMSLRDTTPSDITYVQKRNTFVERARNVLTFANLSPANHRHILTLAKEAGLLSEIDERNG